MRRGYKVIAVLILRLPFPQQLQPAHRVLQSAPVQSQRPNDILLVLLAAAGIQQLPHLETGAYVRGATVVVLQEVVVVFGQVGRGWENGVEFGSYGFLNFAVRGLGLGAEGVSETDGLIVRSWVGG